MQIVKRRNKAAICLLCLVILLSACHTEPPENAPAEVIFLDVGQGDCALIRTEEGDILIDAGTEASQSALCMRLESLGVKELALAIFTHGDEDHMGGADAVASMLSPREIWLGGELPDNETAARFSSAVDPSQTALVQVTSGTVRQIGDLTVSVFYPFDADAVSENDTSVVVKIGFGDVEMLFMGDVGTDGEAAMLAHFGKDQLDCDLLKVGHHGSNTSTGEDFLSAVSPQYAVISCGAGNSYGHPTGAVLQRLERAGVTVLRTDLLGEIGFLTDGKTLWTVEP